MLFSAASLKFVYKIAEIRFQFFFFPLLMKVIFVFDVFVFFFSFNTEKVENREKSELLIK